MHYSVKNLFLATLVITFVIPVSIGQSDTLDYYTTPIEKADTTATKENLGTMDFNLYSSKSRFKVYQAAVFDESGIGWEYFIKPKVSHEVLFSYTTDLSSFNDNGHSVKLSDKMGDHGVRLRLTRKFYKANGFYYGPSAFYNHYWYNDRKTWSSTGTEFTTYYKESGRNHKIGVDLMGGKVFGKGQPFFELSGGIGHRLYYVDKTTRQLNNCTDCDQNVEDNYIKHGLAVWGGLRMSF